MVKVSKYILFRITLIVITLHTIILHPHSEELTSKEHFELHQKSNSLIGIIRLVLHESNDEGLDNLVFAQYDSINKIDSKCKYPNPTISTFKNIQCFIPKNKTAIIVNQKTTNFNKLLFVKPNGLRGPPSLT